VTTYRIPTAAGRVSVEYRPPDRSSFGDDLEAYYRTPPTVICTLDDEVITVERAQELIDEAIETLNPGHRLVI
jgi:hypothetical protein